jgi:hypothetical protein
MSPGTVAKKTEDITRTVVKKLLREYECSVCYETLASAVSLVPCACCFCYACIAGWVEGANKKAKPAASSSSSSSSSTGSLSDLQYTAPCPHCNRDFNLLEALPNRVLDAAIRGVLENVPEDLKEWEERVQAGAEMRKELQANAPTPTLGASAAVPPVPPAPSSSSARQPTGRVLPSVARALPDPYEDARTRITPCSALAGNGFSARMHMLEQRMEQRAHEVFELEDSQPQGFSPTRKRGSTAPGRPTASKRANTSSVRFGDVYDLTSQAPLEPPAPYPAPPPRPQPASSSSSLSAAPVSVAGGSVRPAYYYCAMPVSALRGMGANFSQCPHCLQSLIGTKVAIGAVPGTSPAPTAGHYAVWGNVASQLHWLNVCRDWYHPTCIKRAPTHAQAGLNSQILQLARTLKGDERMAIVASFGPIFP